MAVKYNEETGDYEWINDQTDSTNDGNAGEQSAQDYLSNAIGSGSYWGNDSADNQYAGLLSLAGGGPSVYESQRASPERVAQFLVEGVKESTGLAGDFVDAALGKVDDITKWIGANPKASEMLFKTVAGAWAASEARKASEAAGRNRIEEQNNAARLEQEKQQRYNDSFSGQLPGASGLINKNLTRKDGSRVWDNSGKLTKAA